MWTREELKSNAKTVLRRGYWPVFAYLLIAMMIVGSAGAILGGVAGVLNVFTGIFFSAMDNSTFGMILYFLVYMVTVYGLSFLVVLFGSLPIAVGILRMMSENREGRAELTQIFWAFQGGRYLKIVKVMFHKYIRVFLWSLLFIIPGIIKMYEYYLVEFIISENPDLPPERYLELSSKAMDGEKLNVFVLELSFVGWMLLGILACCVGVWFVYPYYYATFVELYAAMRAKMTVQGLVQPGELRGFGPSGSMNGGGPNGGFGGGFDKSNGTM